MTVMKQQLPNEAANLTKQISGGPRTGTGSIPAQSLPQLGAAGPAHGDAPLAWNEACTSQKCVLTKGGSRPVPLEGTCGATARSRKTGASWEAREEGSSVLGVLSVFTYCEDKKSKNKS